jgi:hypothetical protein
MKVILYVGKLVDSDVVTARKCTHRLPDPTVRSWLAKRPRTPRT